MLSAGCAVDHPTGITRTGSDSGPDSPVLDATFPDASRPGPDMRINDADMRINDPDAGDAEVLTDGGSDVFDAGCITSFCESNVLNECEGGSLLTPRPCLGAACMDGTDGWGCYDFTPSNVGTDGYRWPIPDRVVLRDETWDTTVCSGMPGMPRVIAGACVISFGDVEFAGTHTVVGSQPLVVVSAGMLLITGRINADGMNQHAGPGGDGEGEGSDGLSDARTDGGGGGGGGGFAGGDGGGVTNGSETFLVPRVSGGLAHPGAYLRPLVGGGGGGAGAGAGGGGGGGGGALQFSARRIITITGTINVSGGAGSPGLATDDSWGAGGGGGGGGSVLIESGTTVTFGGNVLAAGGGGGGSASCRQDGSIGHEEDRNGNTAGGGSPSGRCTDANRNFAADGGAGGVIGPGISGGDEDNISGNGGGGGGGAGLVVIRALMNVNLAGSGARRFERTSHGRVD